MDDKTLKLVEQTQIAINQIGLDLVVLKETTIALSKQNGSIVNEIQLLKDKVERLEEQ